jgi:hypothetical protein
MPVGHKERHRRGRIGWLPAAVLGANDGILLGRAGHGANGRRLFGTVA